MVAAVDGHSSNRVQDDIRVEVAVERAHAAPLPIPLLQTRGEPFPRYTEG